MLKWVGGSVSWYLTKDRTLCVPTGVCTWTWLPLDPKVTNSTMGREDEARPGLNWPVPETV